MRGGILKVVAFPFLTKRKFTAGSSESICKKRDGAEVPPWRWGQLYQGRWWEAPSVPSQVRVRMGMK